MSDIKEIAYVGGSKGGTGKSLVSMALVDYFRRNHKDEGSTMIVDTDSSNPDVGRQYKDKGKDVEIHGIFLDEREKGWVQMGNAIEASNAKYVVINSMAASNLAIRAQGEFFENSLASLDVETNLKVFWVMSRNKDSVTLLVDFLKYVSRTPVYPVVNLYFGIEEDFLFYLDKKDYLKEMIEPRGGKTLLLPNMNDMVAEKLYTDEKNIEDLLNKDLRLMPSTMRLSLQMWITKVRDMFDSIYCPNV